MSHAGRCSTGTILHFLNAHFLLDRRISCAKSQEKQAKLVKPDRYILYKASLTKLAASSSAGAQQYSHVLLVLLPQHLHVNFLANNTLVQLFVEGRSYF